MQVFIKIFLGKLKNTPNMLEKVHRFTKITPQLLILYEIQQHESLPNRILDVLNNVCIVPSWPNLYSKRSIPGRRTFFPVLLLFRLRVVQPGQILQPTGDPVG
jgi:hypothetical protein